MLPDGRPLNLVHRDVSPGNVLVSRDGVVKLTDFGVVKSTITTTVAGAVKGKLSYMSPEQITVQNVDHRSDLFSLGVVLYEVATGLRDPRARYQNASELAADLEGYRASGAGDRRSIPVTDIVNLLFPTDSHIAMTPSQGSMVSGSSSISVNTPGFEVGPAPGAVDELDVPLQFMHEHDDPQRPAYPSARDMAPTPLPAHASAPAQSPLHQSVLMPVLTLEQGVPMKLILAVTLLCLVGSLVFWFAVF